MCPALKELRFQQICSQWSRWTVPAANVIQRELGTAAGNYGKPQFLFRPSHATVSTLGGYNNTRLGRTKSETMLSVILQPMLTLVI